MLGLDTDFIPRLLEHQKDDHTPQIFEPSDEPFIIPKHEVLSEASSCALDVVHEPEVELATSIALQRGLGE